MAKRRTWWGNPALRQAITLTEGGGVPAWVSRDENGIPAALDADYAQGLYWDGQRSLTLSAFLGGTFDRNSAAQGRAGGGYASFSADDLRLVYDETFDLGGQIEAGGANVLAYTNAATAGWTDAFLSRTTGLADIFGGSDAIRFTNTGSAGPNTLQNRGVFTGSAETTYVIAEKGNATAFSINVYDVQSGTVTVCGTVFTWSTGLAAIAAGSGTCGAVELTETGPNGQPVYLIWQTCTGTGGNARRISLRPAGNTTSLFNAIVHHVQHEEQGSYSSPIIAAATPASRSADDLIRTVTAGAFSKVLWCRAPRLAGTHVLYQRDDGTEDNRVRMVRASDLHLHYIVTAGGVEQANIDLGEIANDAFFTVAIRAAQDDFAVSLDAGEETTDTSGDLPAGLTIERIGRDTTGNYWNSTIQREVTFQ